MATHFKSRLRGWLALSLGLVGFVAPGCQSTPIDLADGPAPLRMPRPGDASESYEDSLTGGEVFAMYCNQCHNARALGERPYSNYQNVMAHMRVRANLTGTEYAKILEFLRRWHDVPSPTPPVEPSPKRLTFPQPVAELREQPTPPSVPTDPAGPRAAPGPPVQPPPAPAEARPEPIPAGTAAAPPGPGVSNGIRIDRRGSARVCDGRRIV